jgi:hypothetical protein
LIFSEKLSDAKRARIFGLLMSTFQILAFEFLPLRSQPISFKDTLQLLAIHRVLLDKLQNPVMVFRPTSSQRDSDEVLGRHDPSRNAIYCRGNGLGDSLRFQMVTGRKKLNWPASYLDVYIFNRATTRLEVFVDRREAEQQSTGCSRERHENFQVYCRRRFKVECRSDSTADGVLADYAVGLHLC